MRRLVILLALAGVAACDRPQEPLGPEPGGGHAAFSVSMATVASDPTPEQRAVAQVVPGFGGYFIDASGAPAVYLTDVTERPAAEQALAGFLSSFGWTAADLRVVQADYDYLQLEAWYTVTWPLALAVSGAVYSDLDEGSNRLRFGGLDVAALSTMASTLLSAGVPADAFVVELSGPVVQTASLRDKTRPPHGGMQIQFFPTPASPLVLLCTLGFNAVHGGVNSFITNSHCSNVQGGITIRTDYYQSTRGGLIPNPDNFIGFEVDDPDYWMGNECPVGRRCRYSDSARAQYGAGQAFALGRIARTEIANPGTVHGDDDASVLQIHPTDPSYRISAEQAIPVLGQRLHKVGRTTGWTSGEVTATCVNVNITASEITQLCQSRVGAFVAGGDSGSPVFGEHNDGSVFLAGLLWGSSTNLQTGAVEFIFSPLAAVNAELGEMTTFEAGKGKKGKGPQKKAR